MKTSILCILFAALVACTGEPEPSEEPRSGLTDGGSYYIYWGSIPQTIPFNDLFELSVMVHDGADKTKMLTDRELYVDATMPAHGHGMETEPNVTKSESGMYTVDGMLFHMAGEWELTFAVSDGTEVETASFAVSCCDQ